MKALFPFSKLLTVLLSLASLSGCNPQYSESEITAKDTITAVEKINWTLKISGVESVVIIEPDVFSLNNVILNQTKKTFGPVPVAGPYRTYIEKSEMHDYLDWLDLKSQTRPTVHISEIDITSLIRQMRELGITNWHYDKRFGVFIIWWGNNVIRGYRGLMFGRPWGIDKIKSLDGYDHVKEIHSGVYFFDHS